MLFRFLLIGLAASLASPSRAEAPETQEASAAAIDWVARGCTPEAAFGLRFGEQATEPGFRRLDEGHWPFSRLTLRSTERSRRLFLVETVGMFPEAPGSTRSDPEAGLRLFEALDARIVEHGAFTSRSRVLEADGDIEITYSTPTSQPGSRVVLELTFMLGGAWVTCRDRALLDLQFREVFQSPDR